MEAIDEVVQIEDVVADTSCGVDASVSSIKPERESVPEVVFSSKDVQTAFKEGGVEAVKALYPGCGVSGGRGQLLEFFWNESTDESTYIVEKHNYVVLNKQTSDVVCVGPKKGYLFTPDRVKEVASEIAKEWELSGSDPKYQLTAEFIPCGRKIQLLWHDDAWEFIERGNCYANRVWERQVTRILGYRGLSLNDFDKTCTYTLVVCLKGPNSSDSIHLLSIKSKSKSFNKVALPEIETDRIQSMLGVNCWGRIKGYLSGKMDTAYSCYEPIGELSIRYGNRFWTLLTDAGVAFGEYQTELAYKDRITRFDEFADLHAAKSPYLEFFRDNAPTQ